MQINMSVCQTWRVDITLIDNVCICCLQQLDFFMKCVMTAISDNQIVNNSACVNYLWREQFNHCFLHKWFFFLHSIWSHFSSYVDIHITFQMLALTILTVKLSEKLSLHFFSCVHILTLAMWFWSILCLSKMLKNDQRVLCFTNLKKSHYISLLLWNLALWKLLYTLLILSLSLLHSSNIIISL